MLRRRELMADRGGLPAGYRRCSFLQGKGNASTYFVIPAIDITNKPYVLLECMYPSYLVDTSSFGSILNNIRFEHGIGWLGNAFSYNYGNGYGGPNSSNDYPNAQTANGVFKASQLSEKRLLFEYKNDTFYLDGIEQTIARESQYISGDLGIAKNVYLFGTNRGTTKRYFSGRIYRFFVEGQINLIPALDLNGAPCMYDTITKQPFYNKGTGKFGYELMDGTYVAPV